MILPLLTCDMPSEFKFYLRILSACFVVCLGAMMSASEVCKNEDMNGIVTCRSNWSLGSNVTLAGSLSCNVTECRTGLYSRENSIAILDNKRCKYTRKVRVDEVTYIIDCLFMPGNTSFNVIIVSPQVVKNFVVAVHLLSPWRRHAMNMIAQMKTCTNDTNSNVIVSTTKSSPGYRDVGTFQCGQYQGQVFYENASRASLTLCNAHAEWKDITEVHCNYRPSVAFVEQTLNAGYKFIVLNMCNVSVGYPEEAKTTLNIVDHFGMTKQVENGTVITPRHHGIKAYCFTTNGFGNDSSFSTLNVTFEPRYPSFDFSCGEYDKSDRYFVKFLVNFSANPAHGSLLIAELSAGTILSNLCDITGIDVNCRVVLDNVATKDIIVVKYQQKPNSSITLGAWNITEQCFQNDNQATAADNSSSTRLTESTVGNDKVQAPVPVAAIAVLATIGGVLLVISVVVAIAVITRVGGKSGVN